MLDALTFPITADNRTAAVFARIKGDLTGVKGALASVEDRAKRAGRSMRNIGLGMSAGLTAPLTLLGKETLRLYDIQAQAQGVVEQAVLSTGGAAGKSSEELFRMASGLQEISTFGDEDILSNVTAQMLTFTSVTGDEFDRAQKAVLNISTLMKTDLKSTAIQVGKALNDPVKGLTALSRTGIQFTDDQKEVIKALVETGQVAQAQTLILDELDKQFGGQAEAAARIGLGPLKQLGNAIGDVKEELGAQLVTFLPPITDAVKSAVKWFQALSPEVKRTIVVIGGIAAAAGPVLAALGLAAIGIGSLTTAFGGLAAVLLANPIFLAIAAIAGGAYLIYRNWDGITAWFSGLWSRVGGVMTAGWDVIKALLLNYTAPGIIYANWDGIAAWFTELWAGVHTAALIGWSGIKAAMETTYSAGQVIYQYWQAIPEWFRTLWGDVEAIFSTAWQGVRTMVQGWVSDFYQLGIDIVEGLKSGILERWDALVSWFAGRWDALIGDARAIFGIRSPSRVFAGIGENIVEGLIMGVRSRGPEAEEEIGKLTKNMIDVAGQASNIDRQFGTTFSGIVRGASTAQDAVARLLDTLADQALTNFATTAMGALGIGDFLGGLLFSARGNSFSGGRVQAFASGGVVSSPTLFGYGGGTGLMGEAGPEAILPLSRDGTGRLGVRSSGGAVRQVVELIVSAPEHLTIEAVRSEVDLKIRRAQPGMVNAAAQAVSARSGETKDYLGF